MFTLMKQTDLISFVPFQIEESLKETFAENAAKLPGYATLDKEFQGVFRKFEIKASWFFKNVSVKFLFQTRIPISPYHEKRNTVKAAYSCAYK